MPKADGVTKATGRGRREWFEILDAWGALGRPYREISDHLTSVHGLSRWWAQKLIVEYQEARGVREPGIRRNGTFEVGASKTVGVPVDTLFEAFVNPRRRSRWLVGGRMRLVSSQPRRSARFDWEDGISRVSASFETKGTSKASVSVMHERLTDASDAQTAKAMWRDRLAELKAYLEG